MKLLRRWSLIAIGIVLVPMVAVPLAAQSKKQLKKAHKALDQIKIVDGTGSGLDADTVQGMTPAQLRASVTAGPPGPTGPPGPSGSAGDVAQLTAQVAMLQRMLASFYAPVRIPDAPGIGLFLRGSNGNVAPAATFSATALQGSINGVAVAPSGRVFMVIDSFKDSVVAVFDPQPAGATRAAAVIRGPKTQLSEATGVALDREENVYVGVSGNCFLDGADGGVVTFGPGADGDVAPRLVLRGPNTQLDCPEGVALDDAGRLYVADTAAGSVFVFAPGASGDVEPLAIIPRVAGTQGVAVGPDGSVYVAYDVFINVYAPGLLGDVSPIRIILGEHTLLSQPTGMGVDTEGRLFVSDTKDNRVLVFPPGANGDVAPIAVISGETTLLDFPFGIAVPRLGP